MKPTFKLITAVLMAATMAGCGATGAHSSTNSNTADNSLAGTSPSTSLQPTQGVARMLSDLNTLGVEMAKGDTEQVAKLGDQLENTWHSFEDSVKSQSQQDYEGVEKYLDPLVAATKASPLDKSTLSSLAHGLQQSLQKLQTDLK